LTKGRKGNKFFAKSAKDGDVCNAIKYTKREKAETFSLYSLIAATTTLGE